MRKVLGIFHSIDKKNKHNSSLGVQLELHHSVSENKRKKNAAEILDPKNAVLLEEYAILPQARKKFFTAQYATLNEEQKRIILFLQSERSLQQLTTYFTEKDWLPNELTLIQDAKKQLSKLQKSDPAVTLLEYLHTLKKDNPQHYKIVVAAANNDKVNSVYTAWRSIQVAELHKLAEKHSEHIGAATPDQKKSLRR